jgi:hypothetical protein
MTKVADEMKMLKNIDKVVESDAYLHGQLESLKNLANDVRLNCSRKGWSYEASIIKSMQDGLKQCWFERNNQNT